MKTRFLFRITAPILGLSLIPMVAAVAIAWNLHKSQKQASASLAFDVAGMRAGEELAIGIREVRFQLDRFLITGDRSYLAALPGLRQELERWLIEAERAAVTPWEQALTDRVKKGYDKFFSELTPLLAPVGTEDRDTVPRIRALMDDTLTNEILLPAQAYLDGNEEEISHSNADNLKTVDQMVLALLCLGICGPVTGVLAGYGISRGVSRSIVRLSVPVRDAAGKLNEIVGPITLAARWDLEELEGVLHKIAAQIGAVTERLQQSQREVLRAEQLAAVGQMAAGMAHELRNPLMSMKILVQVAAERGSVSNLDGRDLTVLEQEITRLERLVQTFLDFARPPQLDKRSFEVQAVLRQTVDLAAVRAEQQAVRIDCRLPETPLVVQADQSQIRQVALNLLLNALDAVPHGGTIGVQLEAVVGEWLTLQVEDTGAGLPAKLGERIFEPFVTTKETGLGLGLSICKRIVEAHGGEISAANRQEGGACFTVRLPLESGVRSQELGARGAEPTVILTPGS
jgi:two-component system, NtrC family, sensor histidine kinase HydH